MYFLLLSYCEIYGWKIIKKNVCKLDVYVKIDFDFLLGNLKNGIVWLSLVFICGGVIIGVVRVFMI